MAAKYLSALPGFLIIACLQYYMVVSTRIFTNNAFPNPKSANYLYFEEDEIDLTANLTENVRIIGGTDGPERISRYVVAIVTVFTNKTQKFCSGSMVKNLVVLTAASCFLSPGPKSKIERVLVFNIQKRMPRGRVAATVHMHKRFNPNTGLFNVAFVTIKAPFNKPPTSNVVLIPNDQERARPFIAAYGLLSLESEQIPSKVQLLRLERESVNTCKKSLAPRFRPFATDESLLCYIEKNGKGLCRGDSGGPLLQNAFPHFVQRAIYFGSESMDCAVEGQTVWFTRLSYLIYDIQKFIVGNQSTLKWRSVFALER